LSSLRALGSRASDSGIDVPSSPLTTRPPEAIVAWHDGRPITVAQLLADAKALSRRLPDRRHLINACAGRYAFQVAFLACVMRDRLCLLPSGRAPQQLAALQADFPDSAVLAEPDATPSPDLGVAILTADPTPTAMPRIPPGRVACLAFTSGSTGRPVAHARCWGSLMDQMAAAGQRFDLMRRQTIGVAATVPHGHMFGFETTILLPLRANVAVHSATPLYPGDVRAALESLPAPRLLVTSPVHLRALAAGGALPAIDRVVSATAPLDRDLAARIEARFATRVLEIYGCTETGAIASRRTVADDDWRVLEGVRIEAAREPGAAQVHLPHAPQPIELHDVVELGAGGRFRIQGRRDDLIKVGGKRGSLAGLTAELLRIDGVKDGVFVMPEPTDDGTGAGDAMRPFVIVSAPGLAPKAILDELRQRIDPVFVPRRVIMTDALPRNAVGKLPRGRLGELLMADHDADPEVA
jgi:acyl-coenzyme A synthetase/AMP-(fatty) acid ligase